MYGEPNDKLSENEDKDLTSEDEQSDDGDVETDEPVANRQFYKRHNKYAVSRFAISLEEVNYDMIDFDNVEAKDVDVPLEKKRTVCHQKSSLDQHKTQAKHPSSSTKHYVRQTRRQTRIPWYRSLKRIVYIH